MEDLDLIIIRTSPHLRDKVVQYLGGGLFIFGELEGAYPPVHAYIVNY